MELYRQDFWEQMKELGMPVIPHECVMGMKKLRSFLQKTENAYVKVSFIRGLMETWKHIDYRLSKPKLDEMEFRLGALSEDQEFIVENEMEAKKEVGSDQIVVNGQFPQMVQYAIEGKDKTALAMMRNYSSLPIEVQKVNKWITPILEGYGYKGYFSTEIRVGKKDNLPYLIDPTCRHASPCGETYNLMCENLGEMIEGAAEGILVEPKCSKRFAAQAILCADMAETTSVPIYVDESVKDYVCLYNSMRRSDGQECVINTDAQMLEIGSVVGLGSTIDEAIKNCQQNAKKVEAYKLSCYTDKLDEFKAQLLQ